MPVRTEIYLERYLRKSAGRSDLEDALKRLDKLTQEEARMAGAQGLKAIHTVDERVRSVYERIQSVDDRVRVVDINGAQIVFSCWQSVTKVDRS